MTDLAQSQRTVVKSCRLDPASPLSHRRWSGQRLVAWSLCGPAVGWMAAFFALPLAALTATSFCSRGPDGEITLPLTLENYGRLLGFGQLGFDPFYPVVLLRSVGLAAMTTLLCLLAAVPVALWLARLPDRCKTLGLILVVIPVWTNLLVRTYGWQLLLAPDSFVSRFLQGLGLLEAEQGLYPGWGAVLLGMTCDFLPFMVLPVYVAAERLDWRLVEAALDLGASRFQTFRHALWPQIKPGVMAGSILVFLPAAGQFVVPDLLGGARIMLLGNLLQQQFGPSRDWPFGAALATVALLLVVLALTWQRTSSASRASVKR